MQIDDINEAFRDMDSRSKAGGWQHEREKPIVWLTCTCCGRAVRGRQWHNQDTGFGAGDCCRDMLGLDDQCEYNSSYGKQGIHFLVDESLSLPVNVEHISRELIAGEPRLRIDASGFVWWRNEQIEHYSGDLGNAGSEASLKESRELLRRCEWIEATGEDVTCAAVVWRWCGPDAN